MTSAVGGGDGATYATTVGAGESGSVGTISSGRGEPPKTDTIERAARPGIQLRPRVMRPCRVEATGPRAGPGQVEVGSLRD